MLDRQNEPDQQAIDTVNLGRLRAAQEKYASEGGSLRSAFAKAELQGLNTKASKDALKIAKGGGDAADEFLDHVEEVIRQCALLGIRVERKQLDLFSPVAPSAPEDEKAYTEGRQAGLLGHTEDQNPHAPNTPKGMKWLEGCRQGVTERASVMSMPEPHPADEGDDEIDGEEA